eukprot:scpid35014/ scgid32186/ 
MMHISCAINKGEHRETEMVDKIIFSIAKRVKIPAGEYPSFAHNGCPEQLLNTLVGMSIQPNLRILSDWPGGSAVYCCCPYQQRTRAGPAEPVRLVRPWPDQRFAHQFVFSADEVMCLHSIKQTVSIIHKVG